jgi:hypothetical protein
MTQEFRELHDVTQELMFRELHDVTQEFLAVVAFWTSVEPISNAG